MTTPADFAPKPGPSADVLKRQLARKRATDLRAQQEDVPAFTNPELWRAAVPHRGLLWAREERTRLVIRADAIRRLQARCAAFVARVQADNKGTGA